MDPRLHQTFLMVSDVDESVRFYRDAIGLETIRRGERSAEFETGECSLMIEQDFDEQTLAGFGLEPPGTDRGDGVIVVLEVDSVEDVYDRAKRAGATILLDPREVDWGRKMCLIEDPDGYVLEVSRPT